MADQLTPAALAAAQDALAAEHAAVYAFGVIGGVLDAGDEQAAAAYRTHRGLRDMWEARLGPDAVAAEAGYALPFPVDGRSGARRLARLVENRCADTYGYLVEQATGRLRVQAAQLLTDCAVRALSWGADPEPFPGMGDVEARRSDG